MSVVFKNPGLFSKKILVGSKSYTIPRRGQITVVLKTDDVVTLQ